MFTITLNGNSSDLSCDFFPPIEVGKNAKICLIGLQTNNSIPNINETCNKIGITYEDVDDNTKSLEEIFTIPTGSYELNELETVIKTVLGSRVDVFVLKANNNTLKCEMLTSSPISFKMPNSIADLLGFRTDKIYDANVKHYSDTIVNITKVNCINIESNLVSGSFNNGKQCHTIHEFYPNVAPGYKIIEVPRHLVFYSINCSSITHVSVVLKDKNGVLINLRGEPLTVRLLIQDESTVP